MRVRALEPTIPEAMLREVVGKATKKAKPSDLTEEDIPKIKAAPDAAKRSEGEHIPF